MPDNDPTKHPDRVEFADSMKKDAGDADHHPWANSIGTDGFEFIEYAAPDPVAMGAVFERMGFKPIARHRYKNVTL